MDKIFFMVEKGNVHFFVWAASREYAKSYATEFLGWNPDEYIVTPLTEEGDRVIIGPLIIGT